MIEVSKDCVDCRYRDDTVAPPSDRCALCLASETSDGFWELSTDIEFSGDTKLEPFDD